MKARSLVVTVMSGLLALSFISCSDSVSDSPVNNGNPSSQNPSVSDKGYNIIFDKNDGSGEKIVENYDTETISLTPVDVSKARFTRDGYTLLGYSNYPNSTICYELKLLYRNDKGSETWYAVWQKNDEFKINYYFSSDFDGDESKKFVETYPITEYDNFFKRSNAQVKYAECPWTKEGYVFGRWNGHLGDILYPTITDTISGDLNVFAVWYPEEKLSEYKKITYWANNGTDEKVERYYNYDGHSYSKSYIITDNTFEYEKKYFKGWAESPDKTYPDIYPGSYSTTPKSDDYNLYAVWGDLVAVTLDANNGDNPETKTVYFKAKEWETMPENTFTREGYIFNGWSKNPDGKVDYGDSSSVNFSEDMSLYAVWFESRKVTFNLNDGSENPAVYETSISNDGVYTKITPELSTEREHYTFLGWAESPDATKAVKKFSDNYKVDKDMVYYAVWAKCPVITFHANYEGADPESYSKEFTYGEESYFSGEKKNFEREGKILYGWSTKPDAVNPDSNYLTPKSDLDLYAVWRNQTLLITFNANDGSETPETKVQTVEFQKPFTLEKNTFEREGYMFDCWRLSNSAGPTAYYDESTDSKGISDDIILYAGWVKLYKVTLNANDGSDNPQTKIFEAKSGQVKVNDNPFSREGYTLSGWSRDKNATKPDSYISINFDVTLYAVWKAN